RLQDSCCVPSQVGGIFRLGPPRNQLTRETLRSRVRHKWRSKDGNMRFRAAALFVASHLLPPVAFLLFICNYLASQQQPPPSDQRKLALLVGVNRYKAREIPSLEGPVNDVHRMQALLVGKFGFAPEDVTLLTDEQATHAGIVEQFRSIAQKANPGD